MRLQFKDIYVRKPCQVGWDNMDAHAQGRFCNQCQMPVVDFTAMDEAQLNAFMADKRPGERVCGRFRRDQIGRPPIPKEPLRPVRRFRWLQATAATFLLLGSWQLDWAKASMALGGLPAPKGPSTLDGNPTAVKPERLISCVVLDANGENIPDDIVVTLTLPDGVPHAITTRGGFFSFDIGRDLPSATKVQLTIRKQSFDEATYTSDYKAHVVSTTLDKSHNWTVKAPCTIRYMVPTLEGDMIWDE